MKRLAAVLVLVLGSQGCLGHLKKDPDGYYTNESVALAIAVPVVIAAGIGLLVYAGTHCADCDASTRVEPYPSPPEAR